MQRLIDDYCHNCNAEVLVAEFGPRVCPICGKEITDCGDCGEEGPTIQVNTEKCMDIQDDGCCQFPSCAECPAGEG